MNLFEMEKHHTKTLWLLALLLTFSTVVWAQGTPVTGRVSDEKGELLIGVSVQEKGTTNGTITDTNGQYNLKLTSNNPILIVSYIGYKSQEVKVGKQKVLDVILAEDVSSLDEVVVVAYGHQRKVSVVGAQSSMKIEDIKMPTANLSSAIAGRLPGVVAVQRSGEPGMMIPIFGFVVFLHWRVRTLNHWYWWMVWNVVSIISTLKILSRLRC